MVAVYFRRGPDGEVQVVRRTLRDDPAAAARCEAGHRIGDAGLEHCGMCECEWWCPRCSAHVYAVPLAQLSELPARARACPNSARQERAAAR